MEKELILAGVLPPDPPPGTSRPNGCGISKYNMQTLWSSHNPFANLISGREDLTVDSLPFFWLHEQNLSRRI